MLQISLTSFGQLSVDLQGHHVTIPCTLTGLIYLRSLLHDRAREEASTAKIGTRFVPTQAMVDAFIASHRIPPPPPPIDIDLEITL